MIGVSIHTFSLVPGCYKEKNQLLHLLSRAAALSETLRVEVGEQALAPQLAHVVGQLKAALAHQTER